MKRLRKLMSCIEIAKNIKVTDAIQNTEQLFFKLTRLEFKN